MLGKGVGECILIHLTDGEWVIVDSFIGTRRGSADSEPAALAYLRAIGVDVAEQVAAVILTHLHADHCDGIDEVVAACAKAKYSMPSALPLERWNDVIRYLAANASIDQRSKFQAIASAYRYAWMRAGSLSSERRAWCTPSEQSYLLWHRATSLRCDLSGA